MMHHFFTDDASLIWTTSVGGQSGCGRGADELVHVAQDLVAVVAVVQELHEGWPLRRSQQRRPEYEAAHKLLASRKPAT